MLDYARGTRASPATAGFRPAAADRKAGADIARGSTAWSARATMSAAVSPAAMMGTPIAPYGELW